MPGLQIDQVEIKALNVEEEISANLEVIDMVVRITPKNLTQIEQSQAPDKRFDQTIVFNPSVLSSIY